uniref:Ig-like domain-containing protein n=1 Tax=Zonotrichia albicollis TaxID=44394 RepID=A0A8D2QCC5_ZONAL
PLSSHCWPCCATAVPASQCAWTICLSPPVQVGKLSQDVVVRCDTDTSEQHISWTLNGDEEPMAELVPEGQKLIILGLDLPATGNYSCWAGPVLLDSTYVVAVGSP